MLLLVLVVMMMAYHDMDSVTQGWVRGDVSDEYVLVLYHGYGLVLSSKLWWVMSMAMVVCGIVDDGKVWFGVGGNDDG